ncbi:hypothetical protein B0H14DRAFT_3871830 [Mycena olivaceomarginata]|nr:hypothetical protein B0H14DRAFT_3871830 [Mycena olivaceomarginata]
MSLFGQPQQTSNIFGSRTTQRPARPSRRPHPFSGSPARPSSAANANGAPWPGTAFRSNFGLGGQQQQQQQQPNNAASTLFTSALRPPGAAQLGQGQGQQGARPRTRKRSSHGRRRGLGGLRRRGTRRGWGIYPFLLPSFLPFLPSCRPSSTSPYTLPSSLLPSFLACFYIFYHRANPAQVGLYGRPPNTTNDALWARAVRENPDPECLAPVIAVGFDDLRQRVGVQGRRRERTRRG